MVNIKISFKKKSNILWSIAIFFIKLHNPQVITPGNKSDFLLMHKLASSKSTQKD